MGLAPSAASASFDALSVEGEIDRLATVTSILPGDLEVRHVPGDGVALQLTGLALDATLRVLERDRVEVNNVAAGPPDRVTSVPLDGAIVHLDTQSTSTELVSRLRAPGGDVSLASPANLAGLQLDPKLEAGLFRLFPDVEGPLQPGSNPLNRDDSYSTDSARIRFDGVGFDGFAGDVDLYIWGASVRVVWPDGQEKAISAGRFYTGAGADGTVTQYTDRYVHLTGQMQNLSIATTGVLQYWVKDASMQTGPTELSLMGAGGGLTFGGQAHEVRDAVIVVQSAGLPVHVQVTDRSTVLVRASGHFDVASVDGRLLTRIDAGPVALQAAGGLVFGSLAAFAAAALVHLKFFPLFPGFLRRAATQHGGLAVINAVRNPTRRRILEIIQVNPGIQPYHVWKAVGGAFGVTIRGLEVLERLNLVRSIKLGRNKHYYENSAKFSGPQAELLALLATRTVGETFQAIRERPGVTQRELADALGLSASTVCDRIRRLQQAGLIRSEKDNRTAHYVPVAVSFPAGPDGVTGLPAQA